MKSQSAQLPTLNDAKRGETIIEYVSAGLGALTGGLSEAAMIPIRKLIAKRLREMEEAIVADIRNGLVSPEDIIEEERLASFVLRVGRAAIEGVGRRKLRLMANIFFKSATKGSFSEDKVADFWGITEQLSDADMKLLVILKEAKLKGYFDRKVEEADERVRITRELDEHARFSDRHELFEAAFALGRFGFVRASSAWGGLAYFATARCLDYLDHLELRLFDD